LSTLSSHATIIITSTPVTTTAADIGPNPSFPEINGTINDLSKTCGFHLNPFVSGAPHPTVTYIPIVPAVETLTTFDIFTVAGGAIAERLTTFNLATSDGR